MSTDTTPPTFDVARVLKRAKARKLISEGEYSKARQLLNELEATPAHPRVIDFAAHRRLSTQRN